MAEHLKSTADRNNMPFPIGLWVIWTLSVISNALWVSWPTILDHTALDLPRLVVSSALVGAIGLLLITLLEIRLAPRKFL